MFILTALVYPVELGLLCVGAGLLVDRASGRFLPGALLPAVGAAGLIAASQLTTYAWPLAPSTPYVLAALALAGFVLGRHRLRALAGRPRAWAWQLLAPVLAYVLALRPGAGLPGAPRSPPTCSSRTLLCTCWARTS